MSAPPPIGLGLPVYNGERYLRDALDSVLAQTFGDFELWISDNASSDATEEICRSYAARDPRVHYRRSPVNLGLAPNFRRAFELAAGRTFKWVVYDDALEPGYLAACLEVLEASPRAVLAYPRTVLIDAQGRETGRWEDRMDIRHATPSRRLGHVLRHFSRNHCGLGLIRREALERTGLIGSYETSDLVLICELALQGEFHEHPAFLYRRRIHESSSFAGYSTPEEFARRMDTSAVVPAVVRPRSRVAAEIIRASRRAPIGPAERLRCVSELARAWGPRFWRVIAGEQKRWLRERLRAYARRALQAARGAARVQRSSASSSPRAIRSRMRRIRR